MPEDRDHVPSWDGSPGTFESYVTACKWYSKGTKESERKLVVARLWRKLSGAAKSIVRYADPEQFDHEDGLNQFLALLRESPLQRLPVPDSFNRLDKWSNLKRTDREPVAELIVRDFDCTNPRVDGTCVYGPSLAPVDRPGEKITAVAAGATTCLHELAMLISLTVQPCMRWQELGFGRASILYRRTQIMLEAARLLPAHRRLPHVTFLNGLWWKLLALQPGRTVYRTSTVIG